MIVYRVEGPGGEGPYNGGVVKGWLQPGPATVSLYEKYPTFQPAPWKYDDPKKLYDIADGRFAFATLEQFRNWWNMDDVRVGGQWERMRDAGYYVRLYKVAKKYVRADNYQAVFHAPKGKVVKEFSLTRFPTPLDAVATITTEVLNA